MDSEKTNGRRITEAEVAPLPYRSPSTPLPPEGRRSLWWLWLLAACVVVGLGYLIFVRLHQRQAPAANAAGGPGAAGRSLPVLAAAAHRGDMNVYLTGLGTVTPLYTVTLHTRVDGQIDQVAFTEGQNVKQGDLLVQIDPRPFQVQLAQAQGQLEKDQAALKNAQLDLNRFKYLLAQRSVTQQQVDTQEALVIQDEGAAKSDEAQVANANLQLTYARITAPISGRIGLRLVDPGNIVHASDTTGLAVITQLQPIALLFTLPEDDIPTVQKAMKTGEPLEVDAYNRDLTARIATGTLLTIDNQIDPTTGKVRLKAQFPNEDNALFPNQFANARLRVDTVRGAVVVPTAAVQLSPESTYVWVVKPDDTVEMRNVVVRQLKPDEYIHEKGKGAGDESIVLSGLNEGETVVTDGVDKLQTGMKVTVRMAATGGGRPMTGPAAGATSRPAAGGVDGQGGRGGQNGQGGRGAHARKSAE